MVADMNYDIDVKLIHAKTRSREGIMLLRASAPLREHKDLFWVA
jgi:hypothetical protein